MNTDLETILQASVTLGALVTIVVEYLKHTSLKKYFKNNSDILVIILTFGIALLWQANFGSYGSFENAIWIGFFSAGTSVLGFNTVVKRFVRPDGTHEDKVVVQKIVEDETSKSIVETDGDKVTMTVKDKTTGDSTKIDLGTGQITSKPNKENDVILVDENGDEIEK